MFLEVYAMDRICNNLRDKSRSRYFVAECRFTLTLIS